MKKFIRNILLLGIIIALLTLSVNFAYIKMYKGNSDAIDKFASIPETIQICNFGSSHGLYDYNYEDYIKDYTCFNFGLSSQTLSYDYRLFQNYGEHIKEGTVVFITISYFSFFGIDETLGDEFESKNKRYYSILPASLIKEYDVKTDLELNYFPALGVDTSLLVKTLLGRKMNDENDINWLRVSTDIDVVDDAKAAYVRHLEKNKLDESGKRIINQEEIDALYGLIEGCQKKGAVPILITTPYLHEYTDEVESNAPDFYDDFYAIIDKVVADTGIGYYDYAFDDRFSNKYAWFMNADHLNKEGARNFTDVIMKETALKEQMAEKDNIDENAAQILLDKYMRK